MILMKYDAFFVILKSGKFWNCHLLQIIDGALWYKPYLLHFHTVQQDMVQAFQSLRRSNSLEDTRLVDSLLPRSNNQRDMRDTLQGLALLWHLSKCLQDMEPERKKIISFI